MSPTRSPLPGEAAFEAPLWLVESARARAPGPALSVTPLPHNKRSGVTAGVWHVASDDWQAIAKLLSSPHRADLKRSPKAPGHHRYWAREWQLLKKGLPSAYGEAGLRAPRLTAVEPRPEGACLWLEYVDGRSGADLTDEDFADVAERLGRAQAQPADTAEMARLPWSLAFFPEFVESWRNAPWSLVARDEAWQTPRAARHFGGLREPLTALCKERRSFARHSQLLAQALAHNDAWACNLIVAPDGPVLVDWAHAGLAAVGHDAGNLVLDLAADLIRPAEDLPALDLAVTESYLSGLSRGGWSGDRRTVRLGMCLAVAKWAFLVPLALARAKDDMARVYGGREVSVDRLFESWEPMFSFFVERASEARRLADELR